MDRADEQYVSAVLPYQGVAVSRRAVNVDLRNALLCGLAVVIAVLLTNPISESPFNDDWSYSFTVKKLLETGRLTYNGWASASLIAQAYWGLAWVKIFGFSCTVLRLSTLPLAAAAISLCYLLGRRVGLIPRFAVFAALLVGLCPLYLPVANSFMTDAPGLFFIFLSMYLLTRAIECPTTGIAIAWLIAGLIVGGIGGTGRQIVWVVPLLLAPYGAWLRRDNRLYVLSSVLGTALVLGLALLTIHWFYHQPYSIPEYPLSFELHLAVQNPAHYVLSVLAIGLTALWMILPCLWRVFRNWNGIRSLITLLLLIGPIMILVKTRPYYALAPWMKNTLTKQGVLGGSELSGDRPIAMPLPVRIAVAVVVYLVVCCLGADLLIWLSRPLTAVRKTIHFLLYPDPGKALLPAMTLFAAAYFILLLPRTASDMVYDRYVLPIMPCVLFPLLLAYQKRGDRKVPVYSWILLAIYAAYGIAITQDVTALGRARAIATDRLLTAGIPRQRINAGFEFNAQTQIIITGHLNDPRILIPPNAVKKNLGKTFCVQPRYCLEFGPNPITKATQFGWVDYTSFLYPFHRRIYIDEMIDPWWLDPTRAATHPADKWHQIVPSYSDDSGDK